VTGLLRCSVSAGGPRSAVSRGTHGCGAVVVRCLDGLWRPGRIGGHRRGAKATFSPEGPGSGGEEESGDFFLVVFQASGESLWVDRYVHTALGGMVT
jgi:hypothetical protein